MEKIRLIGEVFVDEEGNEYTVSSNELHEECIKYLYECQELRIRDIFCGAVERVFPGMKFVPNRFLRNSSLFLEMEEIITSNQFYIHLKEIKNEDRIKAKNEQAEIAAYNAAHSIIITRKKQNRRTSRFFPKKG